MILTQTLSESSVVLTHILVGIGIVVSIVSWIIIKPEEPCEGPGHSYDGIILCMDCSAQELETSSISLFFFRQFI
jgi:hypothetical protein